MIDLKGKTALITGGSRGIGAACVELFGAAGAEVAFTYFKNESAAKEIAGRTNGGVKYYRCDHSSEEENLSVVKKVTEDFGKIDVLVNNAGIWTYGAIGEMPLDVWKKLIDLNLTGMFIITNAVVPLMKKNGFGRIINISSTASQRGEAFHSHYAASKGAMNAFTKSLAAEIAKFNITVNAVAPGWVDTDMNDEVFAEPGFREKLEREIPVGRIATAEDIAGPALFLASELGRHINGEILNVNGGSVLCG
ncbi:MAG: SDR family oxidoreductase [Chlorobi bacterium]|nr:SDR family oxidoreductase [Chlorobiota bacterium]